MAGHELSVPPQLAVARRKVERAAEHLHALGVITDYLESPESHPIREETRRGNRPNTRKWVAIIQIKDEAPPIASVLAGEFCYGLRSALDMLAYQLAIDHCRPKGPPRGTGFPIHDSEDDFFRADSQTSSGYAPSSGCHKTRGMAEDARAFIKAEQPYGRGDKQKAHMHPLWLLHDACNADKHVAPLVVARHLTPTIEVIERVNADVQIKPRRGPFKDGDVIGRANIFAHPGDAHVKMKATLETQVTFEGGPLDTLPVAVLPEILWFVCETIFRRLDPGWAGMLAVPGGPTTHITMS